MTNDPKHEITPDNRDAADAMFALIGRHSGFMDDLSDSRLDDFSSVLHADPADDLSGLRMLAERMQPDKPTSKTVGLVAVEIVRHDTDM